MKIFRHAHGYCMKLSDTETFNWANKNDEKWPCSKTKNRSLVVDVDDNGLVDYKIDRKDITVESDELQSIVADHLPEDLHKFWPIWKGVKDANRRAGNISRT